MGGQVILEVAGVEGNWFGLEQLQGVAGPDYAWVCSVQVMFFSLHLS